MGCRAFWALPSGRWRRSQGSPPPSIEGDAACFSWATTGPRTITTFAVIDSDGKRLAAVKVPEGASGVTRLVALLAELGVGVDEIGVGTETDRALLVTSA
jgi:hypothetical protein